MSTWNFSIQGCLPSSQAFYLGEKKWAKWANLGVPWWIAVMSEGVGNDENGCVRQARRSNLRFQRLSRYSQKIPSSSQFRAKITGQGEKRGGRNIQTNKQSRLIKGNLEYGLKKTWSLAGSWTHFLIVMVVNVLFVSRVRDETSDFLVECEELTVWEAPGRGRLNLETYVNYPTDLYGT